jgi:predicted GNAT superfamily acetyltransferase
MTQIRPLRTQQELQACVDLQYETWGRDFKDAVPASILMVSQLVGSVAAGAFDEEDRLIGFVFGITGVENGEIVHWSDMLAVRELARNTGIGRDLKEYQRRAVAAVGGKVIYWTFDPLVARNAHLNFNVFGVRVGKYVRDMYGAHTGSELHRGIGTDRLIVAWPVDDAELAARRAEIAACSEDRRSLEAPVIGDPESADTGTVTIGDRARIAAPADIVVLQQNAPAAAARWRASTRSAFERCFAAGLQVHGFQTDRSSHRGFYLLGKDS